MLFHQFNFNLALITPLIQRRIKRKQSSFEYSRSIKTLAKILSRIIKYVPYVKRNFRTITSGNPEES